MQFPEIPSSPVRITINDFGDAADVARGARWLDENFPGWERKVNLEILDINSQTQCICGQVVPEEMIAALEVANGYQAVTTMSSNPSAYGFAGGSHGDHWVRLIKERFDSGYLSDDMA